MITTVLLAAASTHPFHCTAQGSAADKTMSTQLLWYGVRCTFTLLLKFLLQGATLPVQQLACTSHSGWSRTSCKAWKPTGDCLPKKTCDRMSRDTQLILYFTHYLRLMQAKAWMWLPDTFPMPSHNLIWTHTAQQMPGNRVQHPKPPETFQLQGRMLRTSRVKSSNSLTPPATAKQLCMCQTRIIRRPRQAALDILSVAV